MQKSLALQRALSLIKANNFKLCEDQGNVTNFTTFEALSLIETKNTEDIISDYSRYLARSDITGYCFSKDGQSCLGEIDTEAIDKISDFIYNLDSQPRNDFLGNLNTYMVNLKRLMPLELRGVKDPGAHQVQPQQLRLHDSGGLQ